MPRRSFPFYSHAFYRNIYTAEELIMAKNIDLVNGPVLPSLTGLALPIMATSLIQMAYNLTDMLWIGRMGSSAVASVCTCGSPTDWQPCRKWADR